MSWECTNFLKQQKQPPMVFRKKGVLKKSRNIHKKTPVLEPVWCLCSRLYWKETTTQIFSCEYYEIFKTPILKNIWERLDLRVRSHERQNELKLVWDFILVENLTSVLIQLFTCVHMNWDEMKLKTVWISHRLFWPKWNFKPAWDFHVNISYSKDQ